MPNDPNKRHHLNWLFLFNERGTVGPEDETDVNPASVTPSPEAQESVSQETEETTPAATDTATLEPGQEQTTVTPSVTVEPPVSVEAVDENGVPWKNRAVEAARRLQDTQEVIKQTVQEALQGQQQKKEVYTKEHVPMLKKYAQDHPEYADWVDQQLDDIRTREVANVVEQKLTGFQKSQQDEQTKRQAENWVTTDPLFRECFIATPTGKVWNQTHPLAQHMMQILNSPDPMTGKLVKDRPDALYIAADIAYGRFARANLQKGSSQVQKLRKDLAKVNKVANVVSPGKGAPSSAVRSPVKKALDNYSKSYSKTDMQEATKQHLFALGLLKEE